MKARSLTLSALIVCLATVTMAGSTLAPPIAFGEREMGIQIQMNNQSSYQTDSGYFDLDRDIVALYASYGMFYMGAGMIDDARMDPNDANWVSRNGYVIALGARAVVWQVGNTALTTYGQAAFQQEYFGGMVMTGEGEAAALTKASTDLAMTEILVGAALSHASSTRAIYAALDVMPYASGEMGGAVDVDASGTFTLRIGGLFDIKGMLLNTELQLMGNQGIRLGIGQIF